MFSVLRTESVLYLGKDLSASVPESNLLGAQPLRVATTTTKKALLQKQQGSCTEAEEALTEQPWRAWKGGDEGVGALFWPVRRF
jgi:hypothetical protein